MSTPEKPSAEELSARLADLSDRLRELLSETDSLREEVRLLNGAEAPSPVSQEGPRPGGSEPATGVAPPETSARAEPPSEASAAGLSEAVPEEPAGEDPPSGEEAVPQVERDPAEEAVLAARSAEDREASRAAAEASRQGGAAAEAPEPQGRDDLETRIGTVWLNRIGLFSLVVGLAYLARLAEAQMLPWHRVAAGFIGAGVLFGVGWFFSERLKGFARPLMAGGLAAGFFISFAGHFVPYMACLSLGWSLVLMGLFVGGMLACAERWRSESIAAFALFLGHVAAYVAVGNTATLSLVAVLFLSAAALGLMVRHDWLGLALFAVIGAFFSHFLWALGDNELLHRTDQFAVHLSFLVAYYLIFLAADFVFFRRLHTRGREAFTQRQRVLGRWVGPTAMASCASLGAAVFNGTGHWEHIHFFLFPLAAVQLAVLLYHRRQGSDDGPLYLTAATTFVTLGLFSLFGGLALNMALAAEALLFILLDRAINLYFLRFLAQGILAVNFVHFWFSGAHLLTSWPAYVGAVLSASVYFVRARINEHWQPVADEHRLREPGRLSMLYRKVYLRYSRAFAHGQTLAGAVLLSYQSNVFLGPPWDSAALFLFAALAAAGGLALKSPPLLQGALLLQWASAAFLCLQVFEPAGSGFPWTVNQAVAFGLAAIPAVAAFVSGRVERRSFLRYASLGLAAAVVAGFAAAGALPNPRSLNLAGFSWLSLLAPLMLWAGIEAWPVAREPLAEMSEQRQRFFRMGRRRRTILALLTALLGVWAAFQATASTATAVAVLSAVTVLLVTVAFLKGSPYLLIGVLTHQVLTIFLSLWFLEASNPSHALVRWWLLTETVAVASVLLTACPRWQRGSFALGGVVSLAQALGLFLWLSLLPDQSFAPLALWCLPAAGLFVAVELFRLSPARCAVTLPRWPDRWGQTIFRKYSRGLAGIAAIVSSTALGLMLGRGMTTQQGALWSMMAAAGLLLAASLLRSSPYLMAGLLTLLGLMTAHRVFYGGVLVAEPLLEWASVSLLTAAAGVLLAAAPRLLRASFAWGGVLTLTLGIVALGELLFNHRPGPGPSALWLLTFGLGFWAGEELWRGFWGQRGTPRVWRDDLDLEPLAKRSLGLAVTFSGALAVLLVALTWRQFPQPVTMVYVTLGYSILFVALTAALKSPALAAGFAVCLTAAHPLLYGRIGPSRVAESSPLLALLILAVTLAAGIAAEWVFRHLDEPGRRRPAWWSAWYPYLLGFLLAFLFLGPYGEGIFGEPSFGAPARLTAALASFAAARLLGLRWLTRAALAFALLVVVTFGLGAFYFPSMRVAVVPSALLMAVQLVAMERLLAGQDPMKVSRRSPRLALVQRRILVVTAAVVMVVSLALSRDLGETWTTAGWSLSALALMGAGFLWQDRTYRRTALAVFALALVRLFAFDLMRLETTYAMLALLSLGACLVAGSYLYSRYREEIQRWL